MLQAIRKTPLWVHECILDPVSADVAFGIAVRILQEHPEREEARVALISSETEAHLVKLERASDEEAFRVVLTSPPQDICCRNLQHLKATLKEWTVAIPLDSLAREHHQGLGLEPWRRSVGFFGARDMTPWELGRAEVLQLILSGSQQIAKQLATPVPHVLITEEGSVFADKIGEMKGRPQKIAALLALEFKKIQPPVIVGTFL